MLEPKYLCPKQAAAYLGKSTKTLANWRSESRRLGRLIGPRWLEVGRSIRYAVADLDAFMASITVIPAPEGAALSARSSLAARKS